MIPEEVQGGINACISSHRTKVDHALGCGTINSPRLIRKVNLDLSRTTVAIGDM